MHIALPVDVPGQRPVGPDEMEDQPVEAGDYFGTTGEKGCQVWHFDGSVAVRVGVPNPDERSSTTLADGETLRDALSRVPMFVGAGFIIHKMELAPGAYYPRIARPSDQHPGESPGALPEFWTHQNLIAGTLNQVRSLVGLLDQIFQTLHPHGDNMRCYGGAIRNLLILACTECEAQWRGILAANGVAPERPKTSDFVKLLPAMRLAEYSVKLRHYPWLDAYAPFRTWSAEQPTQSLVWYDDYNAAKHDREGQFPKASLGSAIEAVTAVWILLAAQFGLRGMREFEDLDRYFQIETAPRWRYSEVYTFPYQNFEGSAGPISYPF